MKRKFSFLGVLLVILIIILSVSYYKNNSKIEKEKISQKENNLISMMIENEEGTYEKANNNEWPIDKYYFNEELSGCENGSKIIWDKESEKVKVNATSSDRCYVYFDKREAEFSYKNEIQEYIVPKSGTYKLEVWGAQGGARGISIEAGGLGGYAEGEIELKKNEKIYVVVGGQGEFYEGTGTMTNKIYNGGYNGGGTGGSEGTTLAQYAFGGGGATHIAKVSGLLSTLEGQKDKILIVAGGGGGNGGSNPAAYGGSGGGFEGTKGINTAPPSTGFYGTGATQEKGGDDIRYINSTALGTFGQGGNYYLDTSGCKENNPTSEGCHGAGGGGGFFGGGGSSRGHAGGGGGSGYIGNSLLKNKAMYCYNCTESKEEDTKTFTTDKVSSEAISKYAKQGNGYAKITFIG